MKWPGGAVYEGYWWGDQPHGPGRYISQDGDVQIGKFERGLNNFRG